MLMPVYGLIIFSHLYVSAPELKFLSLEACTQAAAIIKAAERRVATAICVEIK